MEALQDDSVAVVLPAAGSGQRFGAETNKLFANLAGVPLWLHAAARLGSRREVERVVISVSPSDLGCFQDQLRQSAVNCNVEFVIGGRERSDSVLAALKTLGSDSAIQWVAVHDAARPLVSDDELSNVFGEVPRTGAAILSTPISGTVKRALAGRQGCETIDRRHLWVALTPQVFSLGLLKQAYGKHNGRPATDDAQLVERLGHQVTLVQGSAENLKITFPEDLLLAEAILARKSKNVAN